ncbi:MAG: signal recognition particle protein [Planctomycetes bacterium]|jgi:signal recognition particle subunit SRP54|nr:signal recognition particle protein [Planctomycetota bacterium]MBT4028502.1 signal recognition particle protein [Planctomycetota bacterium]MBT4559394.1 signal recognition particle protein [Planctomycetota bacterium]MBT5102071.1 signal recognition particle protein [Planctomycetota bacterium]MBT7319079.1 signal recognition particle protein [Planctomycetota bacterium]
MLENLTQSFGKALDRFRGTGKLSESDIQEGLREVRRSLLEADVHFKVAKAFCERVAIRLQGDERLKAVTGSQQVVAAFQEELTALMKGDLPALPANPGHPMVLLLAGLQGAGKTTSASKLALWLRKRKNSKVLLAACDLQRPGAVDQLQTLGKQLDVDVHAEQPGPGVDPVGVAKRALQKAKAERYDVLIVDSAGRLHVDDDLMGEIESVAKAVKPDASYLVLDAMTGQDAVESARAFSDRLDLHGVILTKMDGDARGGAALSVREVTGRQICFLGVGENPGDFEEFTADRMAGRILDMGDIVGLVEKAQEAVDEEAAMDDYMRMMQGRFTMEDLLGQFRMMKKMGSMKKLMGMMPGMGKMSGLVDQIDDRQMARMEAIVLSMTPKERLHPELLDGSRRRRIATGCGQQVSDVNRLYKSFQQMQKQMRSMNKMFSGGRSKKRLLKQLGQKGGLPGMPGLPR